MATYEQSTEYAELGWEVIREHDDLAWIANGPTVGYLASDHAKKSQ